MKKFTKGNWEVTKKPIAGYIISNCDKNICQVIATSEAEANAQLIAAAPELLEALQEALKIIDRMGEEYRSATNKHDSFTRGEFNKLNSAIEKAAGESDAPIIDQEFEHIEKDVMNYLAGDKKGNGGC